MKHMRLLEPDPFSLPMTTFHTPYCALYRLQRINHDHASGRIVTHGLTTGAAATKYMSPRRNCDAALCDA